MKVFIHLDHGIDESYLLDFPESVTVGEVKGILEGRYDTAIPLLMTKSRKKALISRRDRKKAKDAADFTLTESYLAERLA